LEQHTLNHRQVAINRKFDTIYKKKFRKSFKLFYFADFETSNWSCFI